MRKAIVTIVAVAILGVLAIFNNKHSTGSADTTASPSSIPSSNVPAQSTTSTSAAAGDSTSSSYKDGTYTGSTAQNVYGPVQIAAVISGGKITDIKFLQMPSDEQESRRHTAESEPLLKQSALAKQSANIDFVSGATDTSISFKESLQAALNQAANS